LIVGDQRYHHAPPIDELISALTPQPAIGLRAT